MVKMDENGNSNMTFKTTVDGICYMFCVFRMRTGRSSAKLNALMDRTEYCYYYDCENGHYAIK